MQERHSSAHCVDVDTATETQKYRESNVEIHLKQYLRIHEAPAIQLLLATTSDVSD